MDSLLVFYTGGFGTALCFSLASKHDRVAFAKITDVWSRFGPPQRPHTKTCSKLDALLRSRFGYSEPKMLIWLYKGDLDPKMCVWSYEGDLN